MWSVMMNVGAVVVGCRQVLLIVAMTLVGCGGGSSDDPAGSVAAGEEPPISTSTNRVLMFVSYNDVWYAEYKVMHQALIDSGYEVDVVSSSDETDYATTYQSDGNVSSSANSDPSGSNYSDFTSDYARITGADWAAEANTVSQIPISGKIQDIVLAGQYSALVVPGGVGMRDYLLDGAYSDQSDLSTGGHVVSEANVASASEALADLIVAFLAEGKPVVLQCHGAKNIAAIESSPGESIMKNKNATGFHFDASEGSGYQDGETGTFYASREVNYLPYRRIVIDGPVEGAFSGSGNSISRIITTRDWYPQTILAASKALLEILSTYPAAEDLAVSRNVLLIHGGEVNEGDCGAANQTSNDVPCNFPPDLPADYLDLVSLLESDSSDGLDFSASDINVMEYNHPFLPFDIHSQASIESYLDQFDGVVFYKHWSNGITDELQRALLSYSDSGGGIVAIHHGLYNPLPSKNILVSAFEVESSSDGWSSRAPSSGDFRLLNLAQGNFISSYHLDYDSMPTIVSLPEVPSDPNAGAWGYPSVSLSDELYHNTAYLDGVDFGDGTGQVNVILGNDFTDQLGQTKTSAMSKLYNPSEDQTVGRLSYLQLGELKSNYLPDSFYGQVIRNAVFWVSQAH